MTNEVTSQKTAVAAQKIELFESTAGTWADFTMKLF